MFRAGQEDFVLNLLQAVCVPLLPAQEPWLASLHCAHVWLCAGAALGQHHLPVLNTAV